jgi:hypothetical protein
MKTVSNCWLKIDTYDTVHSGWWVKPFSENNTIKEYGKKNK